MEDVVVVYNKLIIVILSIDEDNINNVEKKLLLILGECLMEVLDKVGKL